MKRELVEEQKDTEVFNYNLKQWNLMVASSNKDGSGAASHWNWWDATREQVTNWKDEIEKAVRQMGAAADAVVYAIRRPAFDRDDTEGVELALAPGGEAKRTSPLWSCTATLCGVELGSIHFVNDDDGNLHGIWRNRFTCFNALKVYGNGYTTKTGDDTQSGRFGDGIISSTAVLTRGASMWLMTGGRRFGFEFASQGSHSFLLMKKENAPTASRRLSATDAKDTVFHVTWPASDSIDLYNVFRPSNFLYFATTPLDKMDLAGDGSEALLFDDDRKGKLFVAGVFVCKVHSFKDFGYSSMKIKAEMNRDRSSINYWTAERVMAEAVAEYLSSGKDAGRIYDLVNGSAYAFNRLESVSAGTGEDNWKKSLAREFAKRHPDGLPYEKGNTADCSLIKHELEMEAVPVSKNLYDALCASGDFLTVDKAVTRKFASVGKPVGWSDATRVVLDRIRGMVTALHDVDGCNRDLTYDDEFEVCIRNAKSRFPARIAIDEDINSSTYYRVPARHAKLYLKWATVKKLAREDAKPSDFREFLFAVYELLVKHSLAELDHDVDRRFCSRIADFSEGNFDLVPSAEDAAVDGGDDDEVEESVVDSEVEHEATGSADASSPQSSGKRKASDSDYDYDYGFEADDGLASPSPTKRARGEDGDVDTSHSLGDIGTPSPKSVTDSTIRTGGPSGNWLQHTPREDVAHGCEGELTLLEDETVGTGDEYGAVFYQSSKWVLPIDDDADAGFYHTTAFNIREVLRGVFGWDDSTTFGVYTEDSNTLAFTRGGNQLFVNAFHIMKYDIPGRLWYCFSVLCHETTHMLGYDHHDVDFASALTEVTMKYQPKLIAHLMAQHTSADCGVECLVEHKHTCQQHRTAPLGELYEDL